MKRLKFILLAVFSISSLISCDNDDFQDPVFQAAVDIYVRSVKIGEEVVHAPVIYTYSNLALFSSSVTFKGETTPRYDLDDTFEGSSRLRSVPLSSDFTTTDVENGIYEFEITSTGNEVLKLKDELLEERMEVVNITEFTYDSETHEFDITWDEIENADVYQVKLTSAIDKNRIFMSAGLTSNTYNFKPGKSGWLANFTPEKGTSYTLAVCAYMFESETATSGYDINHETIEYKTIVW